MNERVKGFFKQFQLQFQAFYSGLTTGRKIAIGAAAAVVFALLFAVAIYSPEKKYVTAFTNLTQEDQNSILAYLNKSNLKDFKVQGDSLSFPEEKALEMKMQLAQEGLPSTGVGVGWEKFDTQAFGATDFDQRINKVRAIQGELSRTINKLEPVENSRVHIVVPDTAVFSEDKKPVTASISLKLKAGRTLNPRQIQGVLHLVARAVEGLDTSNIAIVDQDGNMLSKPEEQDGGLDAVTNSQREYRNKVEKEAEAKIREILGRVVGHNKVVAKVQADVEFKKVETTVQDVDPERSAVISSQRSDQSTEGSGMNPTGVPGAKSNLPGEKEDIRTSGSGMSSKQNSETLNFEVKKTLSKIVEPVGTLKKVSAAVLVDGKMVNGAYTQRTPEEIAMITKLVKNAIGFQEARDSLTVENAQFELDEFETAEKAAQADKNAGLLQTGLIAAAIISGLAFLYFGLVRPYFRWLTHDPDKRTRETFPVADYELERSGRTAKRVTVQEEVPFEKLSPKEQIMFLAKTDPKKTTEAIRQLLSPNHS